MQYRDRVTIEPGKRSGKPCIRDTRITVYAVLSFLAAGTSIDDLLDVSPALTRDDVLACLSNAADRAHQSLIARS